MHQYQIFTDKDRHLDQDGHIKEVCQFAEEQLKLAKDNNLPIYGGEFSGNTFICVNADGSTFADPDGNGQLCKNGGCQCEADGGLSLDDWEDPLVQQVRRYVEAQLDAFEKYAGGKSTLWTLIATLFANRGCRLLLLECTRSGLLGFHGRRRKGESLLPQTREGRTWD